MYFDLEIKDKYIAIASNDCNQSMFPSIMQWSEGIYIAILSELDLYFEKNFPNQDTRSSLVQYFAEFFSEDTAVVYGDNPSHLIISVYTMREKGMTGIMDANSKISSRLLQGSSWDSWWKFCNEYEQHRFQLTKKTDKKFKYHQDKLKSISIKMGWHKPWDLCSMDQFSVQKRYGNIICDVFSMIQKSGTNITFPWKNEKVKTAFSVSRHLNFVSNKWDDLEGFLKEDLCKICFLENFNSNLRIINMEWELLLCDLSTNVLQVPFRHPHNLFIEIPEQKTALLQIRHIYDAYLNKVKCVEEYIQYGVIGWNLKVTKVHVSESYQGSLFHDENYEEPEISALENKCLVSFEKIDIKSNPFIESNRSNSALDNYSLKITNKRRPLYMYKSKTCLDFNEISEYSFIERLSHLSWNSEDSDFYLIKKNTNESYWAKIKDNKWEIYGCY